jgi:hypothetical protein
VQGSQNFNQDRHGLKGTDDFEKQYQDAKTAARKADSRF